jgi:A/G-specific adenine glycosylase
LKKFQKKIFQFYHNNKRDLPWRKTTDPYKILLSEFMLQQTQVSRVIGYYQKWIAQWPSISDLAHASRKEVLQSWMGLGYNSRAIYLHKSAKIIMDEYSGDILKAIKNYQMLPGIGPYTSQAVQIFALNEDIITVDTNIRRIYLYEFQLPNDTPDKDLWQLAHRCLPLGRSREWHNALMDYGAEYLTSRKTGISPRTRQSKFEGSDRQMRAKILQRLLKKSVTKQDIQNMLGIEEKRLQHILNKMIKEKLIIRKNHKYALSQ